MNGTGIPDVDFDVGESYAGYLPISDKPDDENELFFWFFPSSSDTKEKEILLWLNGGVSRICSPLFLLRDLGKLAFTQNRFAPGLTK